MIGSSRKLSEASKAKGCTRQAPIAANSTQACISSTSTFGNRTLSVRSDNFSAIGV